MAILMNNPKNSTDSHLLVLLASQPISSICSWGPIEFGGAALRTQKLLGSGLDARPGTESLQAQCYPRAVLRMQQETGGDTIAQRNLWIVVQQAHVAMRSFRKDCP